MSAPLSQKQFRFWRSLGSLRISQVFSSWDFWLAALMASVGTVLYAREVPAIASHVSIARQFLAIAGALFGVVLAGFAIVAALLGDRFAKMLERTNTSAYDMLRHFVIEGGILIASIAVTLVYCAGAKPIGADDRAVLEQAALGFTTFLFFWGLFGALELMKLVFGVAVTSAGLVGISQSAASADDKERRAE